MFHILESIRGMLETIPPWGWTVIISLFVFCAVLSRVRYFCAFAVVLMFAWLIRDLTDRARTDASCHWTFSGVVFVSVVLGILLIFRSVRRLDS